jgi:hypothetical protein
LKKKQLFVALIAIGSVFAGTLPASAAINVVEPFSTEGPLSSDWIASGSVVPSVVKNVGDTPENALRLTTNDYSQNGFVLYDKRFNLSQGVQFEFNQYQWGGSGADGLVFFIKDANDTSNLPGGRGGAMGYSAIPGESDGISGALLGVGFDAYGNFRNYQGTGCEEAPHVEIRNEITIKGPGQGQVGYCLLAQPYGLVANSKKLLTDMYTSRQESAAAVKVVIDSPYTDSPRVKVYYESTLVHDIALPEAFSNTANIKFGFSAGTGSLTNNHEISNLRVKAFDKTLPYIEVSNTEYKANGGGLANTGGSLSDYYLLIGSAMALIGGGLFSLRKAVRTAK